MVSSFAQGLLLAVFFVGAASADHHADKLRRVLVNSAGLDSFVSGVEDSEALQSYEAFTQQHHKHFPNVGAMQESFNNFKQFGQIVSSNQQKERGSARHGVTKFADETPEDFRRFHTGHKQIPETERAQLRGNIGQPIANNNRARRSTPLCLDYRARGVVTEIKDQGQCGDCYAFASMAIMESAWALRYGVNNPANITNYAEAEICDCSTIAGNLGCNGGNAFYTFDYVLQKPGVTDEAGYPYSGNPADHSTCALSASAPRYGVDPQALAGYSWPPNTSEETLADWVSQYGPMYIAIDSAPLQTYLGGVLDPEMPAGGWNVDHAVAIVGFCHDCDTKEDYWICKNSWGADWGEEGYFRLIKGKNALDLTINPVAVSFV